MAKTTTRQQPNIRVRDVVQLLNRAGWDARNGKGSHIVLSKPGMNSITLSDPISRNQWTNLRHTIGTELKHIIVNRRTQGAGLNLTRDEWSRRIQFGKQMLHAGFGSADVVKYAGLGMLANRRLPLSKLNEMDVEDVLKQYIDPYLSTPIHTEYERTTRTPGPIATYWRRDDVAADNSDAEESEPPALAEAVAEPTSEPEATPTPRDDDALLTLMGELHEEIKRANQGSTELAFRYAERLRMVAQAMAEVDDALERVRALLRGWER